MDIMSRTPAGTEKDPASLWYAPRQEDNKK